MPANPDTRPLPPGWIELYDHRKGVWFYQTSDLDINPPVQTRIHPIDHGSLIQNASYSNHPSEQRQPQHQDPSRTQSTQPISALPAHVQHQIQSPISREPSPFTYTAPASSSTPSGPSSSRARSATYAQQRVNAQQTALSAVPIGAERIWANVLTTTKAVSRMRQGSGGEDGTRDPTRGLVVENIMSSLSPSPMANQNTGASQGSLSYTAQQRRQHSASDPGRRADDSYFPPSASYAPSVTHGQAASEPTDSPYQSKYTLSHSPHTLSTPSSNPSPNFSVLTSPPESYSSTPATATPPSGPMTGMSLPRGNSGVSVTPLLLPSMRSLSHSTGLPTLNATTVHMRAIERERETELKAHKEREAKLREDNAKVAHEQKERDREKKERRRDGQDRSNLKRSPHEHEEGDPKARDPQLHSKLRSPYMHPETSADLAPASRNSPMGPRLKGDHGENTRSRDKERQGTSGRIPARHLSLSKDDELFKGISGSDSDESVNGGDVDFPGEEVDEIRETTSIPREKSKNDLAMSSLDTRSSPLTSSHELRDHRYRRSSDSISPVSPLALGERFRRGTDASVQNHAPGQMIGLIIASDAKKAASKRLSDELPHPLTASPHSLSPSPSRPQTRIPLVDSCTEGSPMGSAKSVLAPPNMSNAPQDSLKLKGSVGATGVPFLQYSPQFESSVHSPSPPSARRHALYESPSSVPVLLPVSEADEPASTVVPSQSSETCSIPGPKPSTALGLKLSPSSSTSSTEIKRRDANYLRNDRLITAPRMGEGMKRPDSLTSNSSKAASSRPVSNELDGSSSFLNPRPTSFSSMSSISQLSSFGSDATSLEHEMQALDARIEELQFRKNAVAEELRRLRQVGVSSVPNRCPRPLPSVPSPNTGRNSSTQDLGGLHDALHSTPSLSESARQETWTEAAPQSLSQRSDDALKPLTPSQVFSTHTETRGHSSSDPLKASTNNDHKNLPTPENTTYSPQRPPIPVTFFGRSYRQLTGEQASRQDDGSSFPSNIPQLVNSADESPRIPNQPRQQQLSLSQPNRSSSSKTDLASSENVVPTSRFESGLDANHADNVSQSSSSLPQSLGAQFNKSEMPIILRGDAYTPSSVAQEAPSHGVSHEDETEILARLLWEGISGGSKTG